MANHQPRQVARPQSYKHYSETGQTSTQMEAFGAKEETVVTSTRRSRHSSINPCAGETYDLPNTTDIDEQATQCLVSLAMHTSPNRQLQMQLFEEADTLDLCVDPVEDNIDLDGSFKLQTGKKASPKKRKMKQAKTPKSVKGKAVVANKIKIALCRLRWFKLYVSNVKKMSNVK